MVNKTLVLDPRGHKFYSGHSTATKWPLGSYSHTCLCHQAA